MNQKFLFLIWKHIMELQWRAIGHFYYFRFINKNVGIASLREMENESDLFDLLSDF